MLVDKQNQKLKSKFTNYKKANKAYVINNVQLKAKNNNLENQLTDLEKQLEIACSDRRLTPSSPLLPPLAASPPLSASVVSNDSDENLKQSKKTKSTKLPNPPMFIDDHVIGFDIDVWESKMVKKLTANANYYPTEALRMAYIDSHVNEEAYKHLVARLRIDAQKSFVTAKEIFKVLQKVYGNVNRAHTAMNKF